MDYNGLTPIEKIELIRLAMEMKKNHSSIAGNDIKTMPYDQYVAGMIRSARYLADLVDGDQSQTAQ